MIFYDILRVLQMVKPQKRNPWMEKDNSPSIPGPVLVQMDVKNLPVMCSHRR